jgi:transcriptional regulator with XRE-family HTH domain
MSFDKHIFSERFSYLRENNGLSSEEVAAAVAVTPDNVEAWETGNFDDLNKKTLETIAELFQVPFSYLTDCSVQEGDDVGYLTRAIESLSKNDHDEILKFTEFLQSVPRD